MKKEFPFLKDAERNTLFILGNGFDLYHDALTKYKHFCCWLKLNGAEDFVTEMQQVFHMLDGKADSLWSNFEKALGCYNIDKIYSYYYKNPDDSLGVNKYEIASNKVVDNVRRLCCKISPEMKKWASQISLNGIEQKFELSPQSWYLTFNYTKLLEDIYGIPMGHICHIHGCIDDSEEIITGHDQSFIQPNYNAQSDEEERAKEKIKDLLYTYYKDQKKQIDKNETFFLSLPEIKHIVVIGHSLADIDLGYFGKVLSLTNKNTIWHFSYYSEDDKKHVDKFKWQCKNQSHPRIINEGESINL
jgi:hypothetical protein